MSETIYLSKIAYSIDSITFPGQRESGDLHFVKELPDKAIIGVVDGMGHGHEAAVAAKLAIDTLELHPQLSVIGLIKLCHEKLRSTRGAVMALASINYTDETLTWLSIGNVEGVLLRANSEIKPPYETIFMRPGVMGYRLSQLFATVIPISKGDLLILSTDGIRNDFVLRVAADIHYADKQSSGSGEWTKDELISESLMGLEEPIYSKRQIFSDDLSLFENGTTNITPYKIAKYVTNRFAKGSDDALVAVVKYLGKD